MVEPEPAEPVELAEPVGLAGLAAEAELVETAAALP